MHPTRIFKHPDELEKAWVLYKEKRIDEAKDWPKVQYVGKDGSRVVDYPVLPLTLDGFEIYCYNNYGCVEQYFKNQDDLYKDFIPICSRIKKEIRDHQITGGLLNQFNPSITQRLNGLVEKTQSEIRVEQPLFPDDKKLLNE